MAGAPAVRSLGEISAVFLLLADRLAGQVAPHQPLRLDGNTRFVLARILHDLRGHVPGLRVFGSHQAAYPALAEAQEALVQGQPGAALVSALRGLSCAPQHPELHYAAAAAALENGAVVEAVMLLRHTLWLKPSHPGALADLATMFESGIVEGAAREAADDAACAPRGEEAGSDPGLTIEPADTEVEDDSSDDPRDRHAA